MKTFFTAALWSLFFLSLPATAQKHPATSASPNSLAPEESPWSHLVDSLTAGVSKSAVTSGILYDRALPLAMLHAFNSQQADTTGSGHLRQAFLELYMASYTRTAFRLTPTQFRQRAASTIARDTVPLGILDYQFQYFDPAAVSSGLLTLSNGLLYDVASPSRSPFLQRSLTLIAPLVDTVRQRSVVFNFPVALSLANRTRQPTRMRIDFNDGGPNVYLNAGQSLRVSYATNGPKVLWFVVDFNDGSSASGRAALYVKQAPPSRAGVPATLANLGEVEAAIPFQNYDSSDNLLGRGQVLAVLQNPATQAEFDAGQALGTVPGQTFRLRNPIIVLDGFDPQDDSRIQFDKDPKNLSVFNTLRQRGVLSLLDDHPASATPPTPAGLQRDVIILNFPLSPRRDVATGNMTSYDVDGGSDYIERNAMVLVELLNRLKPWCQLPGAKGATVQQPFTIIGPSMGGLVSRYALAFMERQKYNNAAVPAGRTADYWNHNTLEWVSFDAPHQGANVPLCDQAYLHFYRYLTESANANLEQRLYSVAAKQMLVSHILAPSPQAAGAVGFRDRFMAALTANGEPGSFGYPEHLRRVAIADGRLDGGVNPADGRAGVRAYDMNIHLRSTTAVFTLFFTGFLVNTSLSNCSAYFTPPANTPGVVFRGTMSYNLSVNNSGILNVTNYTSFYPTLTGSQGSFDVSPGGWRDTQLTLKNEAESGGRYSSGQGRRAPYQVDVNLFYPNHCFIPTVSALGFGYQTTGNYQNTGSLPNSYTNLFSRNNNASLICGRDIPFDAYYAPRSGNLEHVTTDAGMQAFLFRELSGQTEPPRVGDVLEEEVLCQNGTPTPFTVKQCERAKAPAMQYSWALTPAYQYATPRTTSFTSPQQSIGWVPNNTDPAPTISVRATRAGFGTSAATIFGPVASETIFRPYHIPPYFGLPDFHVPPGQGVTFEIEYLNIDPATITWAVNTALVPAYNGRTSISLQSPTLGNASSLIWSVTVSALDRCSGQTRSQTVELTVDRNYNPQLVGNKPAVATGNRLTLFPNPADNRLTLHLAPEKNGPNLSLDQALVHLYNSQGGLINEQRISGSDFALDTSNLPAGIYYVVVDQAGHAYRQHVEVRH